MTTDLGFVDRLAGKRVARQETLQALLTTIETFISRYVVLTKHQLTIVTLWTAHTHVIAAADCTPYLQITSATKRAGKTRLLEVLEPLVARPWLTGRTSAAVLIRKTDAERPTLLLDESDAAFNGEKEYAEALRGILNTGYRTSGKASLCVGQGANLTYKDFHTFSAKAIAGIGALPGTIADRAIPIALRRRRTDERCTRWRERDGHREAAPLRQALVEWATREVISRLRDARPALPAIEDDRKIDVLEPLVAIAEAAGGDWPTQALAAAVAICGAAEDTDIVVELLRDLQPLVKPPKEAEVKPPEEAEALFDTGSESVIATKDLLAGLVALEERPWAGWRNGDKPITARGLARLLGPLGIHPTQVNRVRGYRPQAFEDAFARYLPFYVCKCDLPNKTGPEVAESHVCSEDDCTLAKTQVSSIDTGLDPTCTHRTPDPRGPDEQVTSEEDDHGDQRRRY